jgi:hypothetical protein
MLVTAIAAAKRLLHCRVPLARFDVVGEGVEAFVGAGPVAVGQEHLLALFTELLTRRLGFEGRRRNLRVCER